MKRYWFYNPKAGKIAKSLKKDPSSWSAVAHPVRDVVYTLKSQTGLEVWVSNGWWFVDIY